MFEHVFTAIYHDKRLSDFMNAADLFEHGKVLGEPNQITIKTTTPANKEMIQNLRIALENANMFVSFISFDNSLFEPYWNTNVRIISNGNSWYKLCDWIKYQYPFYVMETDQHYYIKSIKVNTAALLIYLKKQYEYRETKTGQPIDEQAI